MTILDRYLLRRHAGALFRTLLSLTALYVLIDLLTQRREDILNYDVPWSIVAQYYGAMLPQIIYRVAPLSMLVSALLVLGESAQNNEVTAALANGISLRRFIRMPVLLAMLMTVAMFGLEETVGAPAARAADTMKSSYFSRNSEAARRDGISWAGLSGDWTCHIVKFNRIALTGEEVLIHAVRPDRVEQIVARRIYWSPEDNQWMLEDGRRYVFSPGVEERRETHRITLEPAPFTERPEMLFALQVAPATKTLRELIQDIRWAEARRMPVQAGWVHFHEKFSQPAINFVMIGLAAPFAMRIRRGGLAISFGASIVIAIAYLIVYAVGTWMGGVGKMPPAAAAWFANALFMGFGIILLARTPT